MIAEHHPFLISRSPFALIQRLFIAFLQVHAPASRHSITPSARSDLAGSICTIENRLVISPNGDTWPHLITVLAKSLPMLMLHQWSLPQGSNGQPLTNPCFPKLVVFFCFVCQVIIIIVAVMMSLTSESPWEEIDHRLASPPAKTLSG